MIKVLLLKNNLVLIARLIEVSTDLGEPDCKFHKPLEMVADPYKNKITYASWPWFTNQKELMIHSDFILTIVDPTEEQLAKYNSLNDG